MTLIGPTSHQIDLAGDQAATFPEELAVPMPGIGDGSASTMHGIEVAAASGGM